jgi:ATP-dependent protease ClpP protease subunit
MRNVRRIAALAGPQSKSMACRIVRNDAGPARLDVYDDIGGGGWFGGGISAADVVAQLADISGDVEVHINSGGGDVFDGIAIYNALASRAGVTIVVDGLAASIASIIAQAGQSRVIAPGAMMMIHDALSMCVGNAADMRETADLLEQVSNNLASVYASKGGESAQWRDAMQAETWYTAQEAVDAGLIDKLADRPATPEAVANHDFSVFAHVPAHLRAAAAVQPVAPTPGPAPVAAQLLGMESMPLAKALATHHTATVDTPWNGPAAVAAMPNDDVVLEYCHAWQSAEAAATPHKDGDDDADDQKSQYKFPHHTGKGAPANLAACRNGLARLDGASIPAADRAGVKAHLQAHLDDAKAAEDHIDHPIDAAVYAASFRDAFKEA